MLSSVFTTSAASSTRKIYPFILFFPLEERDFSKDWIGQSTRLLLNEQRNVIMCAEENLVVKNKDNSIFALEASLLGQIFVLRTSNFSGPTNSR